MATGSERYRKHAVWESLQLKRDALGAARYETAALEEVRLDLIEWLDEAVKTKTTAQPALYLSALDDLSTALNALLVDNAQFRQLVSHKQYDGHPYRVLESALRSLPLPPPRELKASYVDLLDKEIEARTLLLDELKMRVTETEQSLASRNDELKAVSEEVAELRTQIDTEREAIEGVSQTAGADMRAAWQETLESWRLERRSVDQEHDTKALESIATLAAVTTAGEALAEHAAGDLSAADWSGRAKRERRAAQWIRAGAAAAFIFAGSVGIFIVGEAISNNFDISVGGAILRASVAIVIGAFGALLLREAARHFREADTAEDVALSLKALAPFYANSDDDIRRAARVEVGDAVLVKNVLSRFSHRDAAKHGADINTSELPGLVKEASQALNLPGGTSAGS